MSDIYQFKGKLISGAVFDFSSLKGTSFLVVNTASLCGYTKQYGELEKIYQDAKKQGKKFEILAFPCEQFGGQEFSSSSEIQNFCLTKFSISFPLFEKILVRGKDAHPLFVYLTQALPGLLGSKAIKWNFTKFFISSTGEPLRRFAPQDTPDFLWKEVQALCPFADR